MLHETRAQQLMFWRNREAAFFTFFLPVIFFLMFAAIYGDESIAEEEIPGAEFLQAGMIGYGVASTCFAGLAITVVVRRETGVLKRVRATPLPPATYLLALLASMFVIFLIEAALIIGSGTTFFDVPLPANLFSTFLLLMFGAAAFTAMGLGISCLVRSAEGSSAAINAVYLPMAIISGTFFSTESYPPFLQAIAEVLPLTYFTELTRDVMIDGEHIWSSPGAVGVVALWGAIGLAGAIRGFRWQPREA
jgi:ABC-2 type transport system permease protein